MNRTELVTAVAEETGLSNTQAQAAVSAVLDTIAKQVTSGEKVSLAGFGTFELRHRAARTGRNPQTGETMEIAASAAPAFKPAKALKDQAAKS